MPGPLHFLDGKSRDHIVGWLRDALLDRSTVPLEYHDQTVAGAISGSAPALSDQARTDLSAAAIQLLNELRSGRHKHSYIAALLRLIIELDLRSSAVPILRELAATIPALKNRLSWEACSDILFALLNLRDLQDANYWLRIWEHNKRCFSPVTLAALFDLDSTSALNFLPQLPNSTELGDLTAFTLDHSADTSHGHDRTNFRSAAADVATHCKPHIRIAIQTWLKETGTPEHPTQRSLTRLHVALGPPPSEFVRTSSKLLKAIY